MGEVLDLPKLRPRRVTTLETQPAPVLAMTPPQGRLADKAFAADLDAASVSRSMHALILFAASAAIAHGDVQRFRTVIFEAFLSFEDLTRGH